MLVNDIISQCTQNDLIYLGCVTHHPYEQVVVVEHHPLGNRDIANIVIFKEWLRDHSPAGWAIRVAVVDNDF